MHGRYTVWGSNDPIEWTNKLHATNDLEEAKDKCEAVLEGARFLFVAIDDGDRTIWTNDPDTALG